MRHDNTKLPANFERKTKKTRQETVTSLAIKNHILEKSDINFSSENWRKKKTDKTETNPISLWSVDFATKLTTKLQMCCRGLFLIKKKIDKK